MNILNIQITKKATVALNLSTNCFVNLRCKWIQESALQSIKLYIWALFSLNKVKFHISRAQTTRISHFEQQRLCKLTCSSKITKLLNCEGNRIQCPHFTRNFSILSRLLTSVSEKKKVNNLISSPAQAPKWIKKLYNIILFDTWIAVHKPICHAVVKQSEEEQ